MGLPPALSVVACQRRRFRRDPAGAHFRCIAREPVATEPRSSAHVHCAGGAAAVSLTLLRSRLDSSGKVTACSPGAAYSHSSQQAA